MLDTAITSVGDDGFCYRGRSVEALARARTPFEAVADLLWEAPAGEPWPDGACDAPRVDRALPIVERYVDVALALGRADGAARVDEAGERVRARGLLRAMAVVTGDATGDATGAAAGRIAEVLAAVTGVGVAHAWRFDVVLAVIADHELNASSFVARVAASAEADLYGCVSAALQVLKGNLHGGVSDCVEALLATLDASGEAREGMRAALQRRVDAGGDVPGFGHKLYPQGDPRVGPMFDAVEGIASPAAAAVHAYREAGVAVTGQAATVDIALVTFAAALGLPSGTATALFALGRTAGWVAHVLEQRRAGVLLRPRARYVGLRG